MRTALVLLFLLALAAVPGTCSRSAASTPATSAPYLAAAPPARAAARPARHVRRVRLRRGSPRSTCCCSSRWSAAWCRASVPARAGAAVAAAGGAAQPRPAARAPLVRRRRARRPTVRRGGRASRCAAAAGGSTSTDGAGTVSAEKGYLRETGNLVFHVALVVLLVGVAARGAVRHQGHRDRRRGHQLRQHGAAVRLASAPAGSPACELAAAVLVHAGLRSPRRTSAAARRTARRARSPRSSRCATTRAPPRDPVTVEGQRAADRRRHEGRSSSATGTRRT